MSDYLKISAGGVLTLIDVDEQKHEEFSWKEKDGKYTIKNRKTKEVVAVLDDAESVERFFEVERPLNNAWVHLRSELVLDEGVTLGDIIQAIDTCEELSVLVTLLFPFYPKIFSEESEADEDAEVLILKRAIEVEDNFLYPKIHLGFINSNKWVPSTKIEFDPMIDFEGEVDTCGFCLIDVLSGLFQFGDSGYCFLTKEGLFNEEGKLLDQPVEHLLKKCAFADELTLADVFNFVDKDKFLKEFIASYSWCPAIDKFHALAKTEPEEKSNLWFLEVYRYLFVSKDSIDGFSPGFHGIGEVSESDLQYFKKKPLFQKYGIDLCPVNELSSLEVRLKQDVDYVFGDEVKLGYKTYYNLLEALDAIYWEISFFGDPDKVSQTSEDLAEQVRKIKDGTIKTVPFDLDEQIKKLKEGTEDDDD